MIGALERIERELMAAARRPSRRRPSPRVAAAAVAACLAAATGASALTGAFSDPPVSLTPRAGGERTSLVTTDSDGRRWQMRGFRSEDGALCVEIPPQPSPDTGGFCTHYHPVAAAFERSGVVLNVGAPESLGDTRLHFFTGLVPGSARTVTIGSRRARLSEVWAELRPGDGSAAPIPVRAFLLAAEGRYPTKPPGVRIAVELEGGGVRRSAWP